MIVENAASIRAVFMPCGVDNHFTSYHYVFVVRKLQNPEFYYLLSLMVKIDYEWFFLILPSHLLYLYTMHV